jgi:hypothetical protein
MLMLRQPKMGAAALAERTGRELLGIGERVRYPVCVRAVQTHRSILGRCGDRDGRSFDRPVWL